MLADLASDCLF